MADTVRIVYVGPFDEVDVPVPGVDRVIVAKRDAPFDIARDIAEGDGGLLAQVDNWKLAKPAKREE